MSNLEQITKQNKENLNTLKGSEINSLEYEGAIYINKNADVVQYGETIDTLNTNEKIEILFDELYESEFGEFEFIFD